MAVTGYLRYLVTARLGADNSPSTLEYNDGYLSALSEVPGLIQSPGIIPVTARSGALGTDQTTYLYNEALDHTNPTGSIAEGSVIAANKPDVEVIGDFLTASGHMDGKVINPGQTMAYSLSMKVVTSGGDVASVFFDIYHNSGGANTLMRHEALGALTTSYADYISSWVVTTQFVFATGDKIRLIISIENFGVPV